jgi:HAD superfamily hydrolase (TIGR01509 family)
MDKKLFIFDLDGVLVEACDWHRDALNAALREVCDVEIQEEEHISTFNGIPTKEKLKILTRQGRVKQDMHQLINEMKQTKTLEIINKEAKIQQEKINMINKIKLNNHIVCCYTNSIRMTAELMLKKTGVLFQFDEVLTNEDVNEPKPSPEGYLYLMNKHNSKPENTYIIEDSPKGIQSATASGANVIKVVNAADVNIETIRSYL